MDEHIQAARTEIKAFLDEQGRLKALPSKRKRRWLRFTMPAASWKRGANTPKARSTM